MAAGRDKKKCFKSFLAAVLLSTWFERCFVSNMRDFFVVGINPFFFFISHKIFKKKMKNSNCDETKKLKW